MNAARVALTIVGAFLLLFGGTVAAVAALAPPPAQPAVLVVNVTPTSGTIVVFSGSSCGADASCAVALGHLNVTLKAGTYALAFGPLPGYTEPKNGTVDLKGGTLTAINATYAKGQSAQGSSSTTTASPEQSSTTTQSKPTMTSTTIACTGDSYMVGSTCVTKTATTSQSSLNLFICPGQSFANRLCAYLTVTSVTQSRFGNTANTGDLISVTGEVCPVPTASSMGYACEPVSLTGRTGAGGQVQIPVIAEDTEGPAYFAGNLSVSDVTLQSGHQTVDWPTQTSARVYYVAYFSGQVLGLSLFGGLQSTLGIMGTIFLGAFIAIVGAATIAAAAVLPSSEPQARAPRRQRWVGR